MRDRAEPYRAAAGVRPALGELRLTLDETRLIATARQPVDAEILQTLQEQSDGWAAGLVLMLERLKRTGAVNPIAQPETLEIVFNYFAGEIFEQLGESTRDFLIRTSMLPRVTAELANALTGRSDAASVLAELHKRQLFIDRRVGDTLTYQYHALYRGFEPRSVVPSGLLELPRLSSRDLSPHASWRRRSAGPAH